MSIFAVLYVATSDDPAMVLRARFPLKEPAEVTAASGRNEIATARIHAVSKVPSKPDFTSEVYGIDPTHVVFVSLDKADTGASRAELARAIRSFPDSSSEDPRWGTSLASTS